MTKELHEQLRQHAWSLVGRRGRPSQVALRRAVSAGYYALFHRLIYETTVRLVQGAVPGLRARVGRALQHGEMREVCSWFSRFTPPDRMKSLLPPVTDENLRLLCQTFLELQRARYEADYDPEAAFVQSDVVRLLVALDEALSCWDRIAGSAQTDVFITALAFGKRWDR